MMVVCVSDIRESQVDVSLVDIEVADGVMH